MSNISSNLLGFLGSSAQTGYQISRSLRFNSADSAYLSRTPASAGNRKTWTWAGWVKRSKLGTLQQIFHTFPSSGNVSAISFESGDTFLFYHAQSGSSDRIITTTQVFRDASAWYHIVVAVDTNQSTNTDRIKLYLNGVRITQFSSYSDFASVETFINSNVLHRIGSNAGSTIQLVDGYLADVHFIDGQALDPTSFGEFDANGIFQPKRYSGTYGTNGFKLDFADNSSNTATTLGKDTSGNGNNWTPFNLSTSSGGPTSVAAASGALPIFNTTDTYGNTKGTGTRTDSNSSSIVLAVPMDGANNGTTFTDESATIKGSGSAKTITRFNTTTVTAQSKFYGSSGSFNGSTTYLRLDSSTDFDFGSGAFTVESWVYLNALPTTDSWPGSFASWMNIVAYGTVNLADGWQFRIGQTLLAFGTNNDTTAVSATHGLSINRWNHLACTRSGNVYTLYVNGAVIGSATYTANNPGTGSNLWIGTETAQGAWLNGYIQDLRIYKGVAKYTGNFNPPSSTQNATVGAGNDSLVDVPTNGVQPDTGVGGEVRGNYATWNPLSSGSTALANGNLQTSSPSGEPKALSTIAFPTSGKWYYEVTITQLVAGGGSNYGGYIGIESLTSPTTNAIAALSAASGVGGVYKNDVRLEAITSLAVNDVIGIAFDADNLTCQFYRNGSTYGSQVTGLTSATYIARLVSNNASGATNIQQTNFGQRPFAYTAPSGFKALCTANLPAPTITKPSSVFDVKLYTGNGSTQTISGLGFSPDLVWQKSRTLSGNDGWHSLVDSVRGVRINLASNATDSEYTYASETLTAFNSDGFDVAYGTSWKLNASSQTYVAWTWDAGSSTVTNTAGSITSSVRANASAGFSIVTYTGTGVTGTVGHGLGVSPSLVIIKKRSSSTNSNWIVWSKMIYDAYGANSYQVLDVTNGYFTFSGVFGSNVSSTTFPVGTNSAVNGSSDTYVAYCFAPVAGYSSFGSFVGTTSQPFVYLGFRPKLVWIKFASGGANTSYTSWYMSDSVRDTDNPQSGTGVLWANRSDAEGKRGDGTTGGSFLNVDFLSNGFRVLDQTNVAELNYSGATYIYCAWAESPFQYARAR